MKDVEEFYPEYSPGLRAGHAQRQAALAHVERMLKSGHLDGEEAGKRARTINAAKTEGEIALALSDLPRSKPFRQAWKRFDWKEPKCFVPVLLLTSVLSVALGALPFILATAFGWYRNPDLMTATEVPAVIIGFIGLAASIAAIASKGRK